jgi:hypothetical protein
MLGQPTQLAASDTVTIAGFMIAFLAGLGSAVVAGVFGKGLQTTQLAHDRTMRDVTELRAVLDDSLRAISEAASAVEKLFQFALEKTEAPVRLGDEIDRHLRDSGIVVGRLTIRFGRQHELPRLYRDCVVGLHEYARVMLLPRNTDEERVAYEDARSNADAERLKAYAAYVDRCLKEVRFLPDAR